MNVATQPAYPANLVPVLRAFMQRRSIPADSLRSDGRLTLTVDGRYRVHLAACAGGRVALHSDLLTLPDDDDRLAHETLLRLATAAAQVIHRHSSTLCIDRERKAVMLQQLVPAAAELSVLEDGLADFLDALASWTRSCEAEAAALRGEQT